MPLPSPYGQAPPQGYGGMPGYPRGAPRPPMPRDGPPSGQPGVGPRSNGVPPVNGVPRPGPQGAVPPRGPATGAPAPGGRPQPYKGAPPARAGPAAGQASSSAPVPAADVSGLNAAVLSAASPMEQKQLLGEIIYMNISPYVKGLQRGFCSQLTLRPPARSRSLLARSRACYSRWTMRTSSNSSRRPMLWRRR